MKLNALINESTTNCDLGLEFSHFVLNGLEAAQSSTKSFSRIDVISGLFKHPFAVGH